MRISGVLVRSAPAGRIERCPPTFEISSQRPITGSASSGPESVRASCLGRSRTKAAGRLSCFMTTAPSRLRTNPVLRRSRPMAHQAPGRPADDSPIGMFSRPHIRHGPRRIRPGGWRQARAVQDRRCRRPQQAIHDRLAWSSTCRRAERSDLRTFHTPRWFPSAGVERTLRPPRARPTRFSFLADLRYLQCFRRSGVRRGSPHA